MLAVFDEKMQDVFKKRIRRLIIKVFVSGSAIKLNDTSCGQRQRQFLEDFFFTRSGSWCNKDPDQDWKKNFLRVAVVKDTMTFKVHSIRISVTYRREQYYGSQV